MLSDLDGGKVEIRRNVIREPELGPKLEVLACLVAIQSHDAQLLLTRVDIPLLLGCHGTKFVPQFPQALR